MSTNPAPIKSPKISVIIPAYNQAEYVAEAVHSVLNQTCPDFELIVVNDGSTDQTAQVLAAIQDSRMRVVWQPNAGLSAARNTGVRQSTGPLLTFLDSDDYFYPDKLDVLSRYLDNHPEIGLVSGGVMIINQQGVPLKLQIERPAALDLPYFLTHNPFSACAIMLRRSWIDKVGMFDETLRACEDWELWHRMLNAGCQFGSVEHAVVTYRAHTGQMTREAERMRKAIFQVLNKFYQQADLPPEIQAIRNLAFSAGHYHASAFEYLSADFAKGREDLAEAIRLDPALKENGYGPLVKLLAGWADDPRSRNRTDLLERVIAHPPPGHPGLGQALGRARADVLLAPLFGSPRQEWVRNRKDLLSAIWYKPEWLLNRGVLRMLLYAWLKI